MDAADKLRLARECFLDLVESADEWGIETDLDQHDRPATRYTLRCRDFELRQLVEALGIRIRDDELAGAAIERAILPAQTHVPR